MHPWVNQFVCVSVRKGINAEWVDDGFFGYICSAKDMYGQFAGTLTSAVGAGLMYHNKNSGRGHIISEGGGKEIDNRFTATVTIVLNSVNSFLYHLALLPLYFMIATQKMFVCSANSVTSLIGVSGFTITLGRQDLQAASDVSSGQCLTSFYDGEVGDVAREESR